MTAYDALLEAARGRPFAAIVGWPVEHSRSPALHGFWLRQHGLEGHYGRLPVEPKRAAETVRVVAEEVMRTRQPLPATEVSKGREYLKGRLQLRMEDTGAIASWLGRQELLRGRILTVDEVLSLLDRVDVEAVQRVAEDIFRPERFNLAVVGPFRSPSRFEAALR